MAKKNLSLFFVFLTAVLTVMTTVSALNISSIEANVRGNSLDSFAPFSVERGDSLPVQVSFTAWENDTVKVTAAIEGYKRSIESKTGSFDIVEDVTYDRTLTLNIPTDIDSGTYSLSIKVAGKGTPVYADFELEIQRDSFGLEIISISTPSVVAAGKVLTANIVVKNRGSHDADEVFIKASIPELGLEKIVFANDLVYDDADREVRDDSIEKTISLVIPATARKGTYNLIVEASMENSDATVVKQKAFSVDGVGEATATAILPKDVNKKVAQGKAIAFEMTIMNLAETSQSYSIDITGADGWAYTQVSPMDLTLGKEQSKTVTVYLNVNSNAMLGNHALVANVKSGNTVLQQVNFMVDVTKAGEIDALMISAIILAVILVVLIVALILLKAQGASKTSTEEISYY
jgi:uncharacterized membrane protein